MADFEMRVGTQMSEFCAQVVCAGYDELQVYQVGLDRQPYDR